MSRLTEELDRGPNVGEMKYQLLVDGFVLATVNANADRPKVGVQGFLVQSLAQHGEVLNLNAQGINKKRESG